MKQYKAINIKTGETVQGTAREIFRQTGIITNFLYKYARSGSVYMETWRFEALSDKQKPADDETFTNGMNEKNRRDWDSTTKIFKEVYGSKEKKASKPKVHKLRTPYNTSP